MDAVERAHMALELNMLSSTQCKEKLVARAKDMGSGGSGGPTSGPGNRLYVEDNTLRACADNAIDISVCCAVRS